MEQLIPSSEIIKTVNFIRVAATFLSWDWLTAHCPLYLGRDSWLPPFFFLHVALLSHLPSPDSRPFQGSGIGMGEKERKEVGNVSLSTELWREGSGRPLHGGSSPGQASVSLCFEVKAFFPLASQASPQSQKADSRVHGPELLFQLKTGSVSVTLCPAWAHGLTSGGYFPGRVVSAPGVFFSFETHPNTPLLS